MNRCVAPNSAAWLWKYAGPRPISTERLPSLLSWTAVCKRRLVGADATGAARPGLTDVILAEDARDRDLRVPARLVERAVTAREPDPVLVAERAQLQRALRVAVRRAGARERIARIAVELDVLDPARLQEREQALHPRHRRRRRGRADAIRRRRRGRRRAQDLPGAIAQVRAEVVQLDAALTDRRTLTQRNRPLRLRAGRGRHERERGGGRDPHLPVSPHLSPSGLVVPEGYVKAGQMWAYFGLQRRQKATL